MIRVISKPNEHVAVVVCSVEERGRLLRRRYVCPSRQAQPFIEDVPYVWNHQVVLIGGTIEGREGKSLRLILKVVREAHRPQVGDMVLRRKSWRQPDLVDLRVLHDFSVVLSFHGELGGQA